MNISTGERFGPLQEGFSYDFGDGYNVLIGPNDSGKSSILQLTFAKLFDDPSYGPGRVCIILPERIFVLPTTETSGRNLETLNTEIRNQMGGSPLSYSDFTSNRSELPRLLLNHTNYTEQLGKLSGFLSQIGLPELVLKGSQNALFENVALQFHGSGLRSLFSILSALTDPEMSVVLIDEPELGLEPKLQKLVKNILLESSKQKTIIVSTHSHLFVNRETPESNKLVAKEGGLVSVSSVNDQQLFDVVFNLLGNSTEDIFFPFNFLITEGASDQLFMEKTLELIGIPKTKIKVLSASGIQNVRNRLSAINSLLVPLVTNDSPYSKRVVALIDKPQENDSDKVDELKRILDDRLFILPESSIEEYLPDDLYVRVGRNKTEDLKTIKDLRNKSKELSAFKKSISQQLSANITVEDLNSSLSVLKEIVEKASL